MKSKKTTVFVGPMECANCEMVAIHNVNFNTKFHDFPYFLTGIPIITKKTTLKCNHCDFERKLTKEDVKICERALKNKFDDDNVFEGFIYKIKQILTENNVIEDGEINEVNLEIATDKAYKYFAIEQGYDREFYYYMCVIYAKSSITENSRKRMLFRN